MDALHIILPILICSVIGYCTNYIAKKHGPELLEQIDIRGIVRERIEEMEVEELEELTMSVMKQELQAVINLGALIGAVIGIVNVFLL